MHITRDSPGFTGMIGAAEKRGHHRDYLYFSQILTPVNLFCNPQCITVCIPIGSIGLPQRGCATGWPRTLPGNTSLCPCGIHWQPQEPILLLDGQDIYRPLMGTQGPLGVGGICHVIGRGIWGEGVICMGNGYDL